MKRLLSLSAIILLEVVSIFSFYNAVLITPSFAQECVQPEDDCNDGFGQDKACCTKEGKKYKCEPYGGSVVGGSQRAKCIPDPSDKNNNDDPKKGNKNDCIDKAQKGPCANQDDCCSNNTDEYPNGLTCYANRNNGNGLCDLPNQDPEDRNKKAEKRDQTCVEKQGDPCSGGQGSMDCCKKSKDHKDFKCVDKDKKPTSDKGTCEFVDINTGERCLAKGVECKVGDWGCCGEMTCYKAKNKDGKVDEKAKCNEGMAPPPSPPCAQGAFKDGKCQSVPTAFGKLSTDPEGFIKSMFGVLLAMSGGIALLLIMKSGYLIMTAQGKPEALQSGRDQLIAAIVGLIFLIFSFVILQTIGFEILKIPALK